MRQATRGLAGAALEHALHAATAGIEAECAGAAALSCEVVSSYSGGRHELYRYRRYDDVRMVFAPEHALAQFGGAPDNFNFRASRSILRCCERTRAASLRSRRST